MLIKSRYLVVFLLALSTARVMGGTTVDDLRREVEDLRKRVNESKRGPAAPISDRVDSMVAGKYGPNNAVRTKSGKLEIGGLLQIWNMNCQKDHFDVFGLRENSTGQPGTNESVDNGGYRIRRAELKFSMDIHENISSVVMMDPAAEPASFPGVPSNQGLFKSKAFYAPEYDALNGPGLGSTAEVAALRSGAGNVPTLLKEAYILYHGVVPHHDFSIGQFKPKMGEEGVRSNAYLDFGERAMVTQLNDQRDLGVEAHGAWWDDRFQYWLGAFDGAGDFFGTSGQLANRADDNNDKDVLASTMVRPMWNNGPWGSLELGYSGQWGVHGDSHSADILNVDPVNGLNRCKTAAIRQAAWAMYKPMGPVRGMWLRGEWGYQKDRAAHFSVNAFALGSGPDGEQAAAHPFSRQGWYAATGYKLKDSVFGDRLSQGGFWNNLFEPVEFAFRYETFQNIITEDLVRPDTETDLFRTDVVTLGVNYYVHHYNTRIQVNYMLVDVEQDRAVRGTREVKDNVLLFTYQIMF